MSQGFFTNLPIETTIDILSRLPTRTIVQCKCVCKPWLDLLGTHEFAKHHLSNSVPGLAVLLPNKLLKIYEFEDELDLAHHELHYNPVTTINLPVGGFIQGSANGLVLLRDHHHTGADPLYICNPITRDCIQIDCPQDFAYVYPQQVSFGFGTSRETCQHKVVRIFHDCLHDEETHELLGVSKHECHVYSVGTGSWRSTAPSAPFSYNCNSIGAFFNGNLHWLVVSDPNKSPMISCFDLETEAFSAFSAPPAHERLLMDVFTLDDRLCVCDNSSYDEIVIWIMEEYGAQKPWTRKYVIIKGFADESYDNVRPIKVFRDGDILMALGGFSLFYYSNKAKTLEGFDMFRQNDPGAIPYTSSFLSLTSFTRENVSSF